MTYTVTRQSQWPDGTKIVEISKGGLDYTNPDALTAKYPGEFLTFADPREAVAVALSIAKAWQEDSGERIEIGYGATGGMTMPFDSSVTVTRARARGIASLRAWANKRYEASPKCGHCSDVLPEGGNYRLHDDDSERVFCSDSCATRAAEFDAEAERELAEEAQGGKK